MKPQSTINICQERFKLNPDRSWFIYMKNGKPVYCQVADILYFESQEKKIRLVREAGEDTFYGSIRKLGECLDGKGFLSCHQSLLVNCKYITGSSGTDIMLSNGEILPISRRKKQFVMEELKKRITNYGKSITE